MFTRNKNLNFSETKIIPCGLPSQKIKQASNHERLNMLEMVFRGHQTKIDPIN